MEYRNSRTLRSGLLLICLCALMMRALPAGKGMRDGDELYSTWIGLGYFLFNFYDVSYKSPPVLKSSVAEEYAAPRHVKAGVMKESGNSVLYSSTLHIWMKCFGHSAFSTRMLSVSFSVLSIVLVFYFTLLLGGTGYAALLSAALLAVHPLLFDYSQETRAYAMGVFFSLLSGFLYSSIVGSRPVKGRIPLWLLYGLAAAAAVLTHYLTAMIMAAQALHAVLFVRESRKWKALLAAAAAGSSLVACWLAAGGWEAAKQMAGIDTWFLNDALGAQRWSHLFTLPRAAWDVLNSLLYLSGNNLEGAIPFTAFVATACISVGALLFLCLRIFIRKEQQNSALLLLSGLSGLAYALLSSWKSGHDYSFSPRYLIFSVPFLLMQATLTLQHLRDSQSRLALLPGAMMLLMALSLAMSFPSNPGRNLFMNRYPDTHARAAELALLRYAPGDTLVYANPVDAMHLNLYLPASPDVVQKIDTTLSKNILYIRKKGTASLEPVFDYRRDPNRRYYTDLWQ
jgi:uncharacterized membrane protein